MAAQSFRSYYCKLLLLERVTNTHTNRLTVHRRHLKGVRPQEVEMALGDYVVLGGICVGAVLKMNNMKQVESWREKELLAKIAVHVVVERMPLTGWNESDLTFLRTSIADMNEAQHEYEDALATAVFDSTIQLLNELLCRMRTHRARIKSRLRAIAQMEHSLLIMLDETGPCQVG